MKNLIILLLIAFAIACSPKKTNNESKNDPMITITDSSIISEFKAQADTSINFDAVKMHYEKFPERWDTAFQYLANINPADLPLGRTDLTENVYAAVSEYTTKNPEDALFESHQQYIDIQYLVEGKEYIGLTRDKTIPVSSPYDADKDIEFYQYDGGTNLPASPDKYFIFFPEDIHRPCLKMETNEPVKKIVIKIKVD